ncbi:MAG: hypothetical protein JSW28_10615 [Thermoplasmata archaeon]|nr:MAG: hypothetical protein JSW28_10615 [Thermoplasmata archaeon]
MVVSILGTRGCGLSTFIGLFLQTIERYTAKHSKQFIFFVRSETGEAVYEIKNHLLMGKYPPVNPTKEKTRIRFILGYKPPIGKRLTIKQKGKWVSSRVEVHDASSVLGKDSGIGVLSRRARVYSDSKVLGFVVDGSKATSLKTGKRHDKMLKYDKELSLLLSSLLKNRNLTEKERQLQPIMIINKIDLLEKKVKEKVEIKRIEGEYSEDEATEVGNTLFETYLKDSYKTISDYGTKYYFSWVEKDDKNRLKVERSEEWRRAHNVYPYHMYEALVLYLRKMTFLYPDKIKDFKELQK